MHTVPLTIEKPAAGGRMIARLDGQIVLVSGAIPGERVNARIERRGKGVVYAATVDVEAPSPDRRAVAGDPECGGCLYAHVSYPRQLALKSDNTTFHYSASRTLLRDGTLVRTRSWKEDIPRELQ